jgi:Uma2 family endonuclease
MTTAMSSRVTYDEYRDRERLSTTKHEFVAGEIFAMAGGTYDHSTVAVNVVAALHGALRGSPCSALNSDMRVRTGDDTGAYPDASVACGERRFSDEVRDELLNPSVIVEVLSPSTEAYDRGDKFRHYQTIESLREYVLVSTTARRVEVFTRQEDGAWLLRTSSAGRTAELRSIGVSLAVDALYEGAAI